MRRLPGSLALIGGALALAPAAGGALVTGDQVVSYDPGATPATTFDGIPYDIASAALGAPTRFAGVGTFPGVVSPFNPPFLREELVSIGEGGHLTVRLAAPATNAPTNPFGVDLLLFGNGGFIDDDGDFGNDAAVVGDPPVLFGLDAMHVSVSADGVNFVSLGSFTEGFFPTAGYLDSGPFSGTPGSVPTDFSRPVDPTLTAADFAGLDLAGVRALYDGSGGGTPVDIGLSGLTAVSFVKIEVFDDNDPLTQLNAEIDAISVVPEPSTAGLALAVFVALRRRSA